ncbi:MAG: hypothetical protein ACRDPB_03820, partial [Nocardioidaceae bacterium]
PSADATCEPTRVSLVVAGRTIAVQTRPEPPNPMRVRMHVGDELTYRATGNCAPESAIGSIGKLKVAGIEVFPAAGTLRDGGPGTRLLAVKPGKAEFDITQPMCGRPQGATGTPCLGGLAVLRRVVINVAP